LHTLPAACPAFEILNLSELIQLNRAFFLLKGLYFTISDSEVYYSLPKLVVLKISLRSESGIIERIIMKTNYIVAVLKIK